MARCSSVTRHFAGTTNWLPDLNPSTLHLLFYCACRPPGGCGANARWLAAHQ